MPDSSGSLIEVIEDLVPANLLADACMVCGGKGWYFGNRSNVEHDLPFWKMDLDGVPAFDAIWQSARPLCEELAGCKLRVLRQYANGHTYGQGGQPHRDDDRPGTFTLLYYPMPEWKPVWQGETVFHDATGEIAVAVTPKPNRAVFFDARIPHAGRAPSRSCPALRVTVAYKLEAVEGEPAPVVAHEAQIPAASDVTKPALPADGEPASAPAQPAQFHVVELERHRAQRVYRLSVDAAQMDALISVRLLELGRTLRMPGYRPGKIPMEILRDRYGARTRSEVLARLGEQAAMQMLSIGSLPVSIASIEGAESANAAFRLTATDPLTPRRPSRF